MSRRPPHPSDGPSVLRRSQLFLANSFSSATTTAPHPLTTLAHSAQRAKHDLDARLADIRRKYDHERLRVRYNLGSRLELEAEAETRVGNQRVLSNPSYLAAKSVLDLFGPQPTPPAPSHRSAAGDSVDAPPEPELATDEHDEPDHSLDMDVEMNELFDLSEEDAQEEVGEAEEEDEVEILDFGPGEDGDIYDDEEEGLFSEEDGEGEEEEEEEEGAEEEEEVNQPAEQPDEAYDSDNLWEPEPSDLHPSLFEGFDVPEPEPGFSSFESGQYGAQEAAESLITAMDAQPLPASLASSRPHDTSAYPDPHPMLDMSPSLLHPSPPYAAYEDFPLPFSPTEPLHTGPLFEAFSAQLGSSYPADVEAGPSTSPLDYHTQAMFDDMVHMSPDAEDTQAVGALAELAFALTAGATNEAREGLSESATATLEEQTYSVPSQGAVAAPHEDPPPGEPAPEEFSWEDWGPLAAEETSAGVHSPEHQPDTLAMSEGPSDDALEHAPPAESAVDLTHDTDVLDEPEPGSDLTSLEHASLSSPISEPLPPAELPTDPSASSAQGYDLSTESDAEDAEDEKEAGELFSELDMLIDEDEDEELGNAEAVVRAGASVGAAVENDDGATEGFVDQSEEDPSPSSRGVEPPFDLRESSAAPESGPPDGDDWAQTDDVPIGSTSVGEAANPSPPSDDMGSEIGNREDTSLFKADNVMEDEEDHSAPLPSSSPTEPPLGRPESPIPQAAGPVDHQPELSTDAGQHVEPQALPKSPSPAPSSPLSSVYSDDIVPETHGGDSQNNQADVVMEDAEDPNAFLSASSAAGVHANRPSGLTINTNRPKSPSPAPSSPLSSVHSEDLFSGASQNSHGPAQHHHTGLQRGGEDSVPPSPRRTASAAAALGSSPPVTRSHCFWRKMTVTTDDLPLRTFLCPNCRISQTSPTNPSTASSAELERSVDVDLQLWEDYKGAIPVDEITLVRVIPVEEDGQPRRQGRTKRGRPEDDDDDDQRSSKRPLKGPKATPKNKKESPAKSGSPASTVSGSRISSRTRHRRRQSMVTDGSRSDQAESSSGLKYNLRSHNTPQQGKRKWDNDEGKDGNDGSEQSVLKRRRTAH